MVVEPLNTSVDWTEVVTRIRRGDETGVEDLYKALSRGPCARVLRRLDSQSAQDRLHEILVIALAAIRRGELHEPVRLMGFVRTLARRQVAAHIRQAIFSRRRLVTLRETRLKAPLDESPEARTCRIEKLATLRDVLARLVARDREILQRFYLDEQCAARICDDMRLTPTQFRLYKSRALARCFDLAHQA